MSSNINPISRVVVRGDIKLMRTKSVCNGPPIEWQEARLYNDKGQVVFSYRMSIDDNLSALSHLNASFPEITLGDKDLYGNWPQMTLGDILQMIPAEVDVSQLTEVKDYVHGYCFGLFPKTITNREVQHLDSVENQNYRYQQKQENLNEIFKRLHEIKKTKK